MEDFFVDYTDIVEEKEWLLFLAYIGAKRTKEPMFWELYNKLLRNEEHAFHRQAKILEMLYSFAHMQKSEQHDTGN